MTPRLAITEADILDALATVSDAPSEARTMAELKAMSGVGEKRLRRALQVIAAEGRLTVHQIPRADLRGRMQQVPVYTIAPKKGKK